LQKAYGKTVAVAGADLSIPQGICYGLLGPNGAGKSTTISILAGTLNADSGAVTLDGQPVGVKHLEVKQRIGYVPQELALYEELSGLDNLRFFGMLYDLYGADLDARMRHALQIIGLEDRAKDIVRTYSGGMKRRLNIAGALLHDPDFLILDEPTVGVDPQSRNLIFDALETLVGAGKTILYTTHYMEEVERLCKRAAIMDGGKVIAEGEVDELHRLAPGEQVVHIQLRDPLNGDLTGVPGVVSLRQEGPILTLELENLTRDLPSTLQAIASNRGVVEDVRTERPSLETVFLHLTGRHLRD
jgi:ABC-2 type transport system ATP-binding protein